MTAILEEVRKLDARRNSGELTNAEYLAARENLMQSVEEAQTEFVSVTGRRTKPFRTGNTSAALSLSLVVGFGIMGLCIGAITFVLADLNLALTLGVTVLAAIAIALFCAMDDFAATKGPSSYPDQRHSASPRADSSREPPQDMHGARSGN